jgi:periplasmic mercuric ion binding protein
MKIIFTTLVIALAIAARAADVTVTMTDVHICCQSCVKGVAKAVADVKGLTAKADQDAGTVTLTAPDTATVQKGADALVTAGFFGKSSDPAIKINAETGAKNQKVQSITIEGLHLCCGKCVDSVNETLGNVPGVTGNTAAKGAKSFQVTGNFNDKDVFDALQKAGLTGQEK